MVIAILGGLYSLYRRQYFLPLWFFVSLLSQRDGYVYASIPVSLLFAVAVIDLILPAFSRHTGPARFLRRAPVGRLSADL